MDRDQLGERLLATFVGELEDQVQVLNAELLALEASPGDAERVLSVFRVMHTLKGAARAANVPSVEDAAHALEGSLAAARDGRVSLSSEQLGLLFEAADGFEAAASFLRSGKPVDPAVLKSIAARAVRRAGALPERDARSARESAPKDSPVVPVFAESTRASDLPRSASTPPAAGSVSTPDLAGLTDAAPGIASPAPAGPAGMEQVRVIAEKLDSLLNASAGALAAAGSIADRPAEIAAMHDEAIHLEREWRRVVLRQGRLLARAGATESVAPEIDRVGARWRGLVSHIARLARQTKEDSRVLGSTTAQVTDGVRRLRMRPFSEICEALPRVVRDVAATVGKQATLVLAGQEVEADRAVLDALREPLVQLVRNAVDHGLESPSERERKGKPKQGTVTVGASIEGDQLVVTVADDGLGLDADAVREGLEKKGRAVPDGDMALAEALLEGGFSTRERASMVSGRGVGLDVVRSTVASLGGAVSLDWRSGAGTTFTLRLPISLATLRAMIVKVTGQLFAFPLAHVERLVRVKPEEVARVDGRDMIKSGSGFVPIASLARVLGRPLVEKEADGQAHAVVVRAAGSGRGAAFVVDELMDEREIVARALDRVTGAAARNFSGAATLADERIALVLDVRFLVTSLARKEAGGQGLRRAAQRKRPRVLVVDDSITTRTLEESVLTAAGFDVSTAVNGATAWSRLQNEEFDILLSDVEMPIMDGLALTVAVRASPKHKTLPVILVTSLDKPEQRERGLDAGADAYVAKSTFDQDALLATVRRLISEGR